MMKQKHQFYLEVEWEKIESVVLSLEPIFFITKELEKRRVTISAIIPVFRSLVNKLRKSNDFMAQKIATGLESRMTDWDTKKLLFYYFF